MRERRGTNGDPCHPTIKATGSFGEVGKHIGRLATGRGPDGATAPNNWSSVFGGPAWTRVSEADGSPGEWYLHLYAPEQPDWNWRDPRTVPFFDEVVRFWYDRGVDGAIVKTCG